MKKLIWIIAIALVIIFVGFIAASISISQCEKEKLDIEAINVIQTKDMSDQFAKINESKINLDNMIVNLEKNNYDVSELKLRLSVFNDKVEKFKEDYKIYLQKVDLLRDSTCNKNNLKDSSKELDLQLDLLKSDSDDIKSYAPVVSEEVNKISREVDLRNEKKS